MLKKQSLILALVLSIGLTGVGVAVINGSSETQELDYLGTFSASIADKKFPGFPSLESMYGTESATLNDLVVRSDSSLRESTTLPKDVELKMLLSKGTVEKKDRLTTVIYGPSSIDYDKLETFADVMDSHGIIVLYNVEREDFDIEKWYKDVLSERSNTQRVEVNGSIAIGVDNDPSKGETSKLIFHDGRTQVQLVSVGYTLSELIKIASTL